MQTIFFLSLIFILYTYLGYPAYLLLRAKLMPRPVRKAPPSAWPTVSAVIAAKNEEKTMARRIQNLLDQDYPQDLLEIIVASDGSTDATNTIVQEFAASDHRVTLIASHPAQGKPAALNKGVARARGEIIVFADSRQQFEPRALAELVSNFSDPEVGCVSGELIFVQDQDSAIRAEMGAYWHYEKMVRKLESASGSVAGATGAIYAIRKKRYKDLPAETILDDVLTPTNIILQGYRCVFEPSAVAFDVVSKDMQSEMTRKIRTLAGNWQLLQLAPELGSPLRNPIWWGFFSHKIFRLIVPMMLLLLLITNLFLSGVFFSATLLSQVLFYATAAIAHVSSAFRANRLARLVYFFVNLNWAALLGTWYFLSGSAGKAWRRVE
ncbi:MAG: glycosyltransferase family 2 protein [Thermodesulfobacteriota bacterium]